MILSVVFAMIFTVTGLFLSYYVRFGFGDLKPGGTIVLTGVAVLTGLLISNRRK